MRAEGCREWRESLGAYALGVLPDDERASLEAHLEGCAECRAELEALESVARLLPLADPDRLGSAAPHPPPALADRVMATIGEEQRHSRRRRRRRRSFALGGVAVAASAAVLAFFVLGGDGGDSTPSQHVSFASLPAKLKIGATLIPHAYGTEIHVYVKGARSGELCQVFLRAPNGARMPAGSFRYRWGDDSNAILSSALDLSRTEAIGVRVGDQTFTAPVGEAPSRTNQPEEDRT